MTGGWIAQVTRMARDQEGRRFALFLAIGGLNTLVGYLLFSALVFAGWGQSAAVAGATVLGILFNFQSIGRLVFRDGRLKLLPRFLGVYALHFLSNTGLLALLTRNGVAPLLAEALILPVLAVVSFLLMRRFVFAAVPAFRASL